MVIFVRMKHILLIHERTSYVSLIRYSVTWPKVKLMHVGRKRGNVPDNITL